VIFLYLFFIKKYTVCKTRIILKIGYSINLYQKLKHWYSYRVHSKLNYQNEEAFTYLSMKLLVRNRYTLTVTVLHDFLLRTLETAFSKQKSQWKDFPQFLCPCNFWWLAKLCGQQIKFVSWHVSHFTPKVQKYNCKNNGTF
jgi:hypothetical protein